MLSGTHCTLQTEPFTFELSVVIVKTTYTFSLGLRGGASKENTPLINLFYLCMVYLTAL
jgi:hypothetical protein